MAREKAPLRFGLWPESLVQARQPTELTAAAKRLAASTVKELAKLGVTVEVDKARRAHFRSTKIPPIAARLLIETRGDLVESYMVQRAGEPEHDPDQNRLGG
jgi:hypothetical protein